MCFASERRASSHVRATPADIFTATTALYRRCRGGFAVVAVYRRVTDCWDSADPHGHSAADSPGPSRTAMAGCGNMLARKTCSRHCFGYSRCSRCAPAKARIHRTSRCRLVCSGQCVPMTKHTPCIFEYRVFRSSRFDSSTIFRSQGAAFAHGRPARGEEIAPRPSNTYPMVRDPDSRYESVRRSCKSRNCSTQYLRHKSSSETGFVKNRLTSDTNDFIHCPGGSSVPKSSAHEAEWRSHLEISRHRNVILLIGTIPSLRGTTSAQDHPRRVARERGRQRKAC